MHKSITLFLFRWLWLCYEEYANNSRRVYHFFFIKTNMEKSASMFVLMTVLWNNLSLAGPKSNLMVPEDASKNFECYRHITCWKSPKIKSDKFYGDSHYLRKQSFLLLTGSTLLITWLKKCKQITKQGVNSEPNQPYRRKQLKQWRLERNQRRTQNQNLFQKKMVSPRLNAVWAVTAQRRIRIVNNAKRYETILSQCG